MLEKEELSSLVVAVLLLKFQPGNFSINLSTSKFLLFFLMYMFTVLKECFTFGHLTPRNTMGQNKIIHVQNSCLIWI